MNFVFRDFSGELLTFNDYMVGPDDLSEMIFLGAIKQNTKAMPLLLFLVPPSPLEDMDDIDIVDNIYYLTVKDFLESYCTNWLVENVYNDRWRSYERQYSMDVS